MEFTTPQLIQGRYCFHKILSRIEIKNHKLTEDIVILKNI